MEAIQLIVKTRTGKEHYTIRLKDGGFAVYRRRRLLFGLHLCIKMGQSPTQTGALECIQWLSSGTILHIDYGTAGR
jgi:hypothetical protein